jgi:glycosyltransferase involved in cell wall biosynthesis
MSGMRAGPRGRRLCMIVHAAYPVDVRVAREVRVALGEGFEVDVFAMRRPGEPRREEIDGVRVFRMPFSHRRGVGMFGLLWEYVGFTLIATLAVARRTIGRRYGVVQVHNPPDFLMLAALLPRLLGARVLFDVHDLSSDMFAARFERKPAAGLIDGMLRSIEKWATRVADAVITVHEPYRQELVARGVPAGKTSVVMNSFDEGLRPANNGRPQMRSDFRIVYHGTVTPSYGVDLIVEAAALLLGELPQLEVAIYGEGDSLEEVRVRGEQLGITGHLYISGRYLPQTEVLEHVSVADVGVIPNIANRLNRFALSSKLFEYVALGIPDPQGAFLRRRDPLFPRGRSRVPGGRLAQGRPRSCLGLGTLAESASEIRARLQLGSQRTPVRSHLEGLERSIWT